ncbi:MAG: DNA phosphorothioation-dependent restriction protein DptG, partial [Butyrivibrio sp.]|nr:DNA phosphorothioation-dependent restriction protein DptG [Butyrivibrio sp.]
DHQLPLRSSHSLNKSQLPGLLGILRKLVQRDFHIVFFGKMHELHQSDLAIRNNIRHFFLKRFVSFILLYKFIYCSHNSSLI